MENLNIKERERVHFRIGEDILDADKKNDSGAQFTFRWNR